MSDNISGEGRRGLTRRQFLGTSAAAGAAAALAGPAGMAAAAARPALPGQSGEPELVLVNGVIHTMDANNTIARSVAMKNGRFTAVGTGAPAPGPGTKVINLKGRTVIPGIVDGHSHIVLVGNRPGWHVCAEDVFTIRDAVDRYIAASENVPPGEIMTTIGPISAQQFDVNRLPVLSELDEVPRPLYIQAAQGGTRVNSAMRAILQGWGVGGTINDDGVVSNAGSALQRLRIELITPETRRRTALDALNYYNTLGLTTQLDQGAFHAETPATGIASENTYTMHFPFIELNREGLLPNRLRINFLHQDPAVPADPAVPLPTLAPRLRNSFPFFGDDWLRTGGIGEFTGGGVEGLRAIARAGWRAEDHALSLNAFATHVANRQIVHDEIGIGDLRWVLSHVPVVTEELVNQFKAMGGGLFVGWGPVRGGTPVGPAYRMLFDNGIPLGYHADGGDITVINPWLNFYTMITGRNLAGTQFLGDQTLTRWETLYLATRANKWFIGEDDLGSIEVGNHADVAVLDRDFFTCPEDDIPRIKSLLTIVGGQVRHDAGAL